MTVAPDIFISYDRDDRAIAQRYADVFRAQGFEVWWDATLRPGDAFDAAIEAALKQAKAVVVLWSRYSVESRWVRAEATLADRNKTLVPVMIEPCQRPIMFELTHTVDLSHWQGDLEDAAWRTFIAEVRRLVETRTSPRSVQAQPAAARAPAASGRTVLVLPFVNMSGDPEQEYFSDGVTEDVITDLGRVASLTVVSRNTAFSFKGKPILPAQLARTLQVTHVLEGSVRRSGDRVRITAQLLAADTDTQVWAQRYDRTLQDIFAIQDEISEAIVAALKLKLAPEEKRAIERRDTTDSDAYELFLMARQFQRTGSERMKPVVVRLCRRIVELDPQFARAWALMAMAEAEMVQRQVPGASIEQARAAADRAVAIAPDLADAHAAVAEVITRDAIMDIGASRPAIETALRLDPQCYDGLVVAGYVHLGAREYENSVRSFEAAIALEADDYRAAGMVVQAYAELGDHENANAAARRSLARCEKLLAVEPDHGGALGFLVSALVRLGETDRARLWARRATLFDPGNARLHYNLACAMSVLNEVDTSLDLLERISDQVSEGWLGWMEVDGDLENVRRDPRFAAFLSHSRARFASSR